MRISLLSIGLLALLTPLVAAWTKEDREIFRVRDELIAHEGPDVTFYEFLGVSPSASLDDINKAYRKKTRSLHPDKVKQQLAAERAQANKQAGKDGKAGKDSSSSSSKKTPGGTHATNDNKKGPSAAELKTAVKRAGERQARLSIVANVLRGPGRDRYDYFLAHGFPTWKGTEYYYSRYRPGLGTVLAGVFLAFGGGAHYIALYMGWRRQREFIERYIAFARRAAWGDSIGIPGIDNAAATAPAAAAPVPAPPPAADMMVDDEGRAIPVNRKMRRMQERDAKKGAAKDGSGRRGGGSSGRRAQQPGSASGSGTATPQPRARSPQTGSGSGPTGAKKRVVAENGKVLIVDSLGDVYLEQEDEDGNMAEYLLDPNEIPPPTIHDTAVVRLPIWAYEMTLGRFLAKRTSDEHDEAQDKGNEKKAGETNVATNDDAVADDSSGPGKDTPSEDSTEEYELLEKSADEVSAPEKDKAKASGSSSQKQGKANKRKGKKR